MIHSSTRKENEVSDLLKLAAKEKPSRQRRSALDPYLNDLRKLQGQGYTLEQLVEMLAKLGVVVTKQGVHDFLKRRAETTEKKVNK